MTFPEAAELIAFTLFALLFELGERLWPARPVERKGEWKSHAMALLLLALVVQSARRGLLALWQSTGLEAPLRDAPIAVQLIIGFVVIDGIQYGLHRAMHASPLLWRAHLFHHSPAQVHWLSGFRTSALHAALFSLPQALVPHALLGLSPGRAALGFTIGAFFQLWTHANIRLDLAWLEFLFVTPRYHRAHHALAEGTRGKNLAMIFTFWDRAFGTHVDPAIAAEAPLGIEERVTIRSWIGV